MSAVLAPRPSAAQHIRAVPAEYMGRARLFRTLIQKASDDWMKVIPAVVDGLQRRARRAQRFEAKDRIALARSWQCDNAGRLSLASSYTKRVISISEVRLAAVRNSVDGWQGDEWEAGVSIRRIRLFIENSKYNYRYETIATCSLHCLGRRYQRSRDVSHAAILDDFRAVADAAEGLADATGDFEIPVRDERWVGHVTHVSDNLGRPTRVLALRTFLD